MGWTHINIEIIRFGKCTIFYLFSYLDEMNNCKGRFDTQRTYTTKSGRKTIFVKPVYPVVDNKNACMPKLERTYTDTEREGSKDNEWLKRLQTNFRCNKNNTASIYLYDIVYMRYVHLGLNLANVRTIRKTMTTKNNPKQRKGAFGFASFFVRSFVQSLNIVPWRISMNVVSLMLPPCAPWFVCVCMHVCFFFLFCFPSTIYFFR